MKIKQFMTTKSILMGTATLLVFAVLTVTLVLVLGGKPSKALQAAVDAAWSATVTEDQPVYLSKLDGLSSYRLRSVKKEGDKYVITAVVSAPDLGGRLLRLDTAQMPQEYNAEMINTFLCEQLEKSAVKRTAAQVYAYKVDGEYRITFTDMFVDAMNGNLYAYAQQTYLDMLQNQEKGE